MKRSGPSRAPLLRSANIDFLSLLAVPVGAEDAEGDDDEDEDEME